MIRIIDILAFMTGKPDMVHTFGDFDETFPGSGSWTLTGSSLVECMSERA
jgi:hypothetical protein